MPVRRKLDDQGLSGRMSVDHKRLSLSVCVSARPRPRLPHGRYERSLVPWDGPQGEGAKRADLFHPAIPPGGAPTALGLGGWVAVCPGAWKWAPSQVETTATLAQTPRVDRGH